MALASELRADRSAVGSTPGALEVWLLMRSLRTLHLRVERQSATAAELAHWLDRAVRREAGHPLAGPPTHAHWASHCYCCGGLLSFDMESRGST